jgi:hypothetical protein
VKQQPFKETSFGFQWGYVEVVRQAANSGRDRSYWEYLDRHAQELFDKGVTDAFTRSLGEALRGNDGS